MEDGGVAAVKQSRDGQKRKQEWPDYRRELVHQLQATKSVGRCGEPSWLHRFCLRGSNRGRGVSG